MNKFRNRLEGYQEAYFLNSRRSAEKENRRKVSIVIADDDRYFSQSLVEELRISGYRADSIVRFDDVIGELSRVKPDVLLLDYYLPEKTGIQILREIESEEKLANLDKILISGDDVSFLAEQNKVAFLEKPFEIEDVVKLLERGDKAVEILSPVRSIKNASLFFDDLVAMFSSVESKGVGS